MLSNNNDRVRALKATLYSMYIEYKTMFVIISEIMLFLLFLRLFLAYFLKTGDTVSSSLNSGFMIALWAIPISIMILLSKSELLNKFSFPVDRNTLALAHLIYILLSPLAIFLPACGVVVLEYIVYSLLQASMPNFIFLWFTTRGSFITGFLISYSIIILISSITYVIFMFFYRHKLPTSVIAGVIVLLLFTSAPTRSLLGKPIEFLFFHGNALLFIIVCFVSSLIFWGLGTIPLRRMEVKK